MKNGFKFEVTEGCTEITPDGEKLRKRLLVSVACCCCIEQNPTGFQCTNLVTLVIAPVMCKSENASFHSSKQHLRLQKVAQASSKSLLKMQ